MIEIIVKGDTYEMRRALKREKFQWQPKDKVWVKRVTEASLNATLEAIRPPVSWSEKASPVIYVLLRSVDLNGNLMSDEELSIKLKPQGEREGVDFLAVFSDYVSNGRVKAPLSSECESHPYDKAETCAPSPPKKVDEAFF